MQTHIQKHIVFTQECHSASSTSRSFTSFVLSHCVYLSKEQGWWSTFIFLFSPCVLDNGVHVCGTFPSLLCGTCSLPLSGLRVSKAFILACVRVCKFARSLWMRCKLTCKGGGFFFVGIWSCVTTKPQHTTRIKKIRQDKTTQYKRRHVKTNVTQDRTRQDKKGQDKTRPESTRQNNTKQYKTTQGKTRQAKTKQGKTIQDQTSHDKTRHVLTRQD
jgi:hypothetical protein